MLNSNYKKYVHPVITIILMLLGHIIPPVAPITPMGMKVLFTFIGMVYGWSTCGMLWPSLLGIVLLGFTGYVATPEAALGLMLTNTTFVASLVSFILFAYINNSGLLDVLSQWVATRKFAAGKPWIFMSFLFLVLGIAAPFVGNPVILILFGFGFVTPLLKKMGYTKDEALPTYMMIGVSLCGIVAVWPYFMPTALYTNGIIATAIGTMLTPLQYTVCIAMPSFLAVILYLLVGKFICRIDTDKFVKGSNILLEEISGKKIEINNEQKKGALVLGLFTIGMVLPSVLPSSWVITKILSQAGVVGVCIILTVALLIICNKEGEPLAEFAKLVQGISWDMLMLVGAIMVIASALISGGTGIIEFISGIMVPLLAQMPLVVFVILVSIFLCILSQFSMNMVLQMIFAPILAPILLAAGYNPMIAVMAVFYGTQFAYLAPSGSMMAAMVFGNTEWVNKTQLYKICIPWIIISLAVIIVLSLTIPNIFCSNLTP